MKYEFTGQTKVVGSVTLKQIRAVAAIAALGVAAGEIGGWIEKEPNLSQLGDAWVSGNAQVWGNAWVSGNAHVSGDARVSGNAQVSGDAWVSGNAHVSGDAWVSGNAHVSGDARVSGNARVEMPTQCMGAYFKARSGTYYLTLTIGHFQWGCRNGSFWKGDLRHYLKSEKYPAKLAAAPLAFLRAFELANGIKPKAVPKSKKARNKK